ncbi:hypothetical protein MMC07_002507 [Pseudocyphellaria aurata]|nr:hypothetical protein [Pseudocyphellaria aurata]
MAQLAQLAQLAQTSPALLEVVDKIPDCVKLSVIEQIVSSSCNADIPCLCTDSDFLKNLCQSILRSCEPSDQDITLHLAQGICSEKLPSMNESQQTKIIALIVVLTIASTVAVILRLVARSISTAKYGMDDLLIVIGLLFTYGLNANELLALPFGFGRHQLMLSFKNMKSFLLIYYETQIILTFAITVTRFSLLCFYYRVFPMQKFRKTTAITGFVLFAWWVGTTVTLIFSCKPIHSFWDKSIEGQCRNELVQQFIITATELATTIAVMVLPIPWLWGLQLPTSKKFALAGIFLLGGFVCIACAVRYPLLLAFHEGDASYTVVPIALWVEVECNVGIVSVCLPIMRPLFLNRSAHPVRSRFSAFRFGSSKSKSKTGTKGVSRAAIEDARAANNWSGNTLTSIGLTSFGRSPSPKVVDDEPNLALASQAADQGHDDDGDVERNASQESDPWEPSAGSVVGPCKDWQLDVIPTWTSLESGIRADERSNKWGIL